MPVNKADRGAEYDVEGSYPKTFEGEGVSPNNVTCGLVKLEVMVTGKDPLLGTGLTYGPALKYDVSPPNNNPEFGVVAPSPQPIGSPASPSTAPYSPGNPYEGMGGF